MSRSSESRPPEGDRLTDREIQILSLVAAGERTAAIGERLGISENTVKSHLTRVYKKLRVLNRVQATRYYLDHYTTVPPASPETGRLSRRTGEPSVIERQVREIEARLKQLAPAATEAERLRQALDALRDLEAE